MAWWQIVQKWDILVENLILRVEKKLKGMTHAQNLLQHRKSKSLLNIVLNRTQPLWPWSVHSLVASLTQEGWN